MTSRHKGFLSAYIRYSSSLQKTSSVPVIGSGIAFGIAGALVGSGLSAIWGKLSDKPNIRRDLFWGLVGGVLGAAGGMKGAHFAPHSTQSADLKETGDFLNSQEYREYVDNRAANV